MPALQGIVLDIEGTTTPIGFVYDVLFPFARAHLQEYLRDPSAAGDVEEVVRRLHEEWSGEIARGEAPPPWRDDNGKADIDSVVALVEWLMDRDRKSPALKLLQGRIWERGYRSGELRGEVFPDVPPALERWRAADLPVAIYSSGSVLAQRLLFATTAYGDLTRLISTFFDTGVGAKTSVASYRRIASAMGSPGEHLLFVSDVIAELDAARAAGWQVRLCIRPGNRPQQDDGTVQIVRDFGELKSGGEADK